MSILALIPTLAPLIEQIIARIPDPAARDKAKAEADALLLTLTLKQAEQQVEINTIEAAQAGWFKAGWRPAVGWTCAFALAWQYVFSPIFYWLSLIMGWTIPMPPMLDDILWELIFGMLGLAGFRTFEKVRRTP